MLLSLSALLFVSCGNKKEKSEAEELQKVVEAVHDETMAKMGKLRYYQDTLTTLIRELNVDSNGVDSALVARYTEVLIKVNEADDEMMDWMRNYNPRSSEMTKEDRIKYLNSEKEKIEEVQKKMDQAIEKAAAIIEKK